MNRPLLWVAASLVAGTAAGGGGWLPGLVLPLTTSVIGFLIPVFSRRSSRLGMALAFFGAGALLWNARHAGPPGDPLARFALTKPAAAEYTLEGTVSRPDVLIDGDGYMQFQVRVDCVVVNDREYGIEGGTLIRWTNPGFSLYAGDRVRIEGKLEHDLSRINWNTPSAEDFYRRHGIHTAMHLRGGEAVARLEPGSRWSPVYWASRLRGTQARRLAEVVPEAHLPFVLTVWLGDRRRITNETYQHFLESGTAHILAVSGVHMGIVFVSAAFLLRLLIRNRRARTLASLVIVFLFVLMAGARVSSLRAAIMIALYLVADLFGREPDAPTALSAAAILFTIVNPGVLLDAGFQLSFLSVGSILLFQERLENALARLPRLIRQGASISLAVQVLPFPVAVSLFHVVPVAAPIANLIVVPLLSVALWLCFLTSLCSLILGPAAVLLGNALVPVVVLIEGVSKFVAGIGGSHVFIVSPTPSAMAAFWVSVGLVTLYFQSERYRTWVGAGAGVSILAAFLFWTPLSPPAELQALDVGHGDAIFVRTPGGKRILIDGGERSGAIDRGRRIVAPFLWSNHVGSLDCVIASHADSDHMGGLLTIVDRFPIGALYLGPFPSGSAMENELLAKCAALDVPVIRVGKGDVIDLGETRLEVLHPPRNWPPNSSDNDRSLTIRAVWPGFSALLTGDIEAKAEIVLSQGDVSADLIKAPHHGSKTSSSARFIEAVGAETALISVGRRFRRSVLSEEVIERYEQAGASVYRTDTEGGIRVVASGGKLKARGAREERGYLFRVSR